MGPDIDLRRAAASRADLLALSRIGSGPDAPEYYADHPAADWGRLKELEKRGLAATRNQSDWWVTDAGRRALADAEREGR